MMTKIKSKYILKKIFENISQKKYLQTIKFNKKLRNKLEINLKDYKIYNQIEIELKATDSIICRNKVINIDNKDKSYFHIYINDKKRANKENIITKRTPISKIIIKIDFQIKSLKRLFKNCNYINKNKFL